MKRLFVTRVTRLSLGVKAVAFAEPPLSGEYETPRGVFSTRGFGKSFRRLGKRMKNSEFFS
jgi:hypothetical protein